MSESTARPYAVTEQLPDGQWRATVHIPHDPRTPLRSVPLVSLASAADWAASTMQALA